MKRFGAKVVSRSGQIETLRTLLTLFGAALARQGQQVLQEEQGFQGWNSIAECRRQYQPVARLDPVIFYLDPQRYP
jgi:hypothetical protein